jgi:drug/metabolite transporter (DMT)-like permease
MRVLSIRSWPCRPSRARRAFGVALIVGLSLAWGTNWVAMKVALEHLPPWTYRALTSFVAGAILLLLCRLNGGRVRPYAAEWKPLAICGVFNITFWHMLTAYALIAMGTGHVALLAHTMPVWAALIAVIALGQRLTPRLALATALGATGIMALFWRHVSLVADAPFAPLLGIGAAFAWAIGTIYQKGRIWSLPILAMAGWQLMIAAAPVGVVAAVLEGFAVPPLPVTVWAALAYTVLLSQVFSYFAWFKIVEIFPTQVAALATLLTPLIGVLSSALLLDETLGWPELAAMALCGSALALVLFVVDRREDESAAPEPTAERQAS